jgi:N-acetylglucosaminyldiphosphoundecaprenol N-acetyl-beta-D-mannosaminyltransferase
MTGADWIYDLCHLCAREGFRLYLLGSGQGVAEEAARRLNSQIPGLSVVGAQSGYFAQDEEGRVLQAIHAATPDILVLGIGTPRQEIWMTRMKELLEVPVVWGAGGVFDYASGRLSRPPWWMRKLALEWLGRMMIEPRRLALRYLLGIPVFLVRSLVHVFSGQPQRLSS